MSEQSPHLIRIQAEFTDLEGKLERLDAFIGTEKFSSLDIREQQDLFSQASAMRDYKRILTTRISRATGNLGDPWEKSLDQLVFDTKDLLRRAATEKLLKPAPVKTERFGNHYSLLLAIGGDHTLEITLSDEALAELCRGNTEESK